MNSNNSAKTDNDITLVAGDLQVARLLVHPNLLSLRHYHTNSYVHYTKDHQRTDSIRQKEIEWQIYEYHFREKETIAMPEINTIRLRMHLNPCLGDRSIRKFKNLVFAPL